MIRYVFYFSILLNYIVGYICTYESILYAYISVFHLPNGILFRVVGWVVELCWMYAVIILQQKFFILLFGVSKLTLALLLLWLVFFSDKSINGNSSIVLIVFALISLCISAICLLYPQYIKKGNPIFL